MRRRADNPSLKKFGYNANAIAIQGQNATIIHGNVACRHHEEGHKWLTRSKVPLFFFQEGDGGGGRTWLKVAGRCECHYFGFEVYDFGIFG